MKLLWRGQWLDVPRYSDTAEAERVRVDQTVSLAHVENATGRTIDHPAVKVFSFLLTDGPRAVVRKARTKIVQAALTKDYHLVLALGRSGHLGKRLVCLAPRMPPCSEYLLAHEDLCRYVSEDFSDDRFERVARFLVERAPELAPLASQSYLYSGQKPPARLMQALDESLRLSEESTDQPASSLPRWRPLYSGNGSTYGSVHGGALPPRYRRGREAIPVAVLGAGDYVWMEVAPALRRAGLKLSVICDREPQIAALAGKRLGFAAVTTNAFDAIDALAEPGAVVIATYHDSHASLAAHALEQGHWVFLEKPAIVSHDDLDLLLSAAQRRPGRLEIGFNRRYNPLVQRAKSYLARQTGPTTLLFSIRELTLAKHHWYFWANQGTRVAGNLCHWIDLAVFLLSPHVSPVKMSVSPQVVPGDAGADTERTFSIEFSDGSAAFLLATDRGDSTRGVQEFIEARRGLMTLRLDDLWRMTRLQAGWPVSRRMLWRDKGHQRMYREALGRLTSGKPVSYPIGDLAVVGALQLAGADLATSSETVRDFGQGTERALP